MTFLGRIIWAAVGEVMRMEMSGAVDQPVEWHELGKLAQVEDGRYQDGDVILVRARPALRAFARYDHAALAWTRRGTLYTVEAGLSGVRSWTWAHWGRDFDVFRPEGASAMDGAVAVDAALARLGEWYAFWNLVPIIGKMLRRRVVSVEAVVCTELVAQSWAAAGVWICPGNAHPSPDELYEGLR